MRKRINLLIVAVLTATSVILPHAPKIIPEGNSLIAAAAVAATLSIPSKSVAAIMPARIVQIAVISMPQTCDAGVMEQLCSSVTSFLDEEAARSDAAVKGCKDKCGWKKRKDDLIDAARKKAKESCSKSEVPDVNELSKGLDRNTKDRLKDLYNRNSRMFDGTAKLKAVDFNAASAKNATITGKTASLGKGGNVTDLKSSEPDLPKLNTASEFSLSGKKLFGETPGQAATKQSPGLLASASLAKSPTGATASAKTAASATAKAAQASTLDSCAACRKHAFETGEFPILCYQLCCKEQVAAGEDPASSECYPLCTNKWDEEKDPCKCCKKYNSKCTTFVPGCTSGGCGEYDPEKSCCINNKVVDKLQTPTKTLLGSIKNCKNRVQAVSEKVVRPEKQGCSIDPRLGHLINIWERRFSRDERLIALMLSWKITKGLATKLFNLDSGRPPITDFNDPFKGLTPPFRGSCDEHDHCYGRCRKNAKDSTDRQKCDKQLLTELKDDVCFNAKYPLTKDECNELAEDMVWGLRNLPFGGSVAYAAAQIEHCKCDLCP